MGGRVWCSTREVLAARNPHLACLSTVSNGHCLCVHAYVCMHVSACQVCVHANVCMSELVLGERRQSRLPSVLACVYVSDLAIGHHRRGCPRSIVTLIQGLSLRPGARTSDLSSLVALVTRAAPGVRLVGVGFSMGAIVLANYLGVVGANTPLSAAVAISGCMDAVANKGGYAAASLQPFLTYELKQNFCTGPYALELARRGVDLAGALSAHVSSIEHFDIATVVPYNGFDDVDDYYRHMSVGFLGKAERVAVPLLHLHACDDPIIDCDTFAPYLSGGAPLPGCLHFVITRHGGHVGWCEGWRPWEDRWGFQNRTVFTFVDAVLDAANGQNLKPKRTAHSPAPRHRTAESASQ